MPKVDIQGISKTFQGTKKKPPVVALDGVSFTVDDGDFAVIVGPSGCGKTTLLRIIAGLEDQDEGAVFYNGACVDGLPPNSRHIAFVTQNYALYPHMTVFDNIAFPLKIAHVPIGEINARVEEVADMLGISILLTRKPRMLSGGQQQRVALGRAIINRPNLFLFDEPLSNVDAQARTVFRHELMALHKKLNATYIFVTHDRTEAMTVASKLIVMNGGKIEQIGTPLEVYNKPSSKFVLSLMRTGEVQYD